MIFAHQPGSQPLTIPEQIPNPIVQPAVPTPDVPAPKPTQPVKIPEKAAELWRPVEIKMGEVNDLLPRSI